MPDNSADTIGYLINEAKNTVPQNADTTFIIIVGNENGICYNTKNYTVDILIMKRGIISAGARGEKYVYRYIKFFEKTEKSC